MKACKTAGSRKRPGLKTLDSRAYGLESSKAFEPNPSEVRVWH